MDKERLNILKNANIGPGDVCYWMSREQRVSDNWPLFYSAELARNNKRNLVVLFNLVDNYLNATLRHYDFMIKGLRETEKRLNEHGINLVVQTGDPAKNIQRFIESNNISALVTDFDPLRIKLSWKREILKYITIPFHEVDGHNIVPCRVASDKQEYGAYTLRPKIHRLLNGFLVQIPELITFKKSKIIKNDWQKIISEITIDRSVTPVEAFIPGEKAAMDTLKDFISSLDRYPSEKNDPTLDSTSNLSPYLHFGQISAQRIALEVSKSKAQNEAKKAFLEELIVRKELSDNFCYFNRDYDTFNGLPEWSKRTLTDHWNDNRDHIYSLDELEKASTHDDLWNASQKELLKKGKMHGYMRMYWAKKILEWTKDPDEAIRFAIYLNDKYELDGRDPNGYTGILWSIGGLHDRPWKERAIFGKVRYMSYQGAKKKFDIERYIDNIEKI